MKKLIIAISSLIVLGMSSAMSMDLRPSIGISANMAAYAASGTENNYNEAGTAVDTITQEDGAFKEEFGSIFVELQFNDVISLGLDYVPTSIVTPTNTANKNEGNENSVSAEFEDLTTAYLKLNIPLGGLYAKVGYSQVDVVSIETNANSYGNDDTRGYVVGLGYNHELAEGVSIRAEVSATEFDDVKANNGQTNLTEVKVKDMIGARGSISLVKSF